MLTTSRSFPFPLIINSPEAYSDEVIDKGSEQNQEATRNAPAHVK